MDSLDTADTLDTLDTLTLASLDRECQGPWEAEYSYGEEADLHQHYDNCTKNPGHENFIPVHKFSIDELPERYRDNDMVEYIKAESDLTVRVTVKYVSERRPKTVIVSDKIYPGYCHRGQRRTTVGSGTVNRVSMSQMGQTCKCKDCRKSSTPHTEFAKISIITAAHVVYDESEGAHTTCHLFFDRKGTPETCKGVVALTGMYDYMTYPKSDYCIMCHYTHDLGLAQRLEKRCQQRESLKLTIRAKLQEATNFKYRKPALDKQPLLFIISHPHGCSKQISIGRWTSSRLRPNDSHSYTYNTATCPGSSGAPVCMPQMSNSLGIMDFYSIYPTHVGKFDKLPGMNFSIVSPGPGNQPNQYSLQLAEGPQTETFTWMTEEDLLNNYNTCRKNQGHKNLFLVDKFSMGNLPPFYRTDEIMDMIKCASDLTVRISVKYVSEQKPETVPDTDIPYPRHNSKGNNQIRVGSGWVSKVECFNNDVCECEECQSSDTPKIGYAHVYVKTAAHLVCDELEGKHTTCHLFYDSGETPDTCKGVVTLKNMCYMNTDDDTCELMYKTHDLDLADKLEDFKRRYVNFLGNWYLFFDGMKRTQNGTSKETLVPPLDIVVSHPHGRAKHISVGYCGSHGNTDTEDKCLYTSLTCPGSSGAPVIPLGRECLYPSVV